jgi:hypothetical protein
MDEFQLLAAIAVSAAVGFIAASVKHGRSFRSLQMRAATTHVESITRMANAAIQTLTEDYKVPEEEAKNKLFGRALALGMALVQIDPKTGESTPIQVKP